jgi:hypothetical protein
MLVLLVATGAILVWAVPPMLHPAPRTVNHEHPAPASDDLATPSSSEPDDETSSGGDPRADGRATPVDPAGSSRTTPEAATSGAGRPAGRDVTIPAGTPLRVRLSESVASDTARVEDAVVARLSQPVVVRHDTVLPAGSEVRGHVIAARRSGKVKGRAYLALRFTEIHAPNGERYTVRTRSWAREAPASKRKDAAKIAAPAAGGAIVGGVIGGKKGAGIGAAIGGGAGTGVVLSTRGQEVRLGRGATLVVRLAESLTVRVPS